MSQEKIVKEGDSNPQDVIPDQYWSNLNSVRRRISKKISGDPDRNWVDHTLDTYYKDQLPIGRCLSLGCGRGRVERAFAQLNAFAAYDAYDISEKQISQAQAQAIAEGFTNIQYHAVDINEIQLPTQHFDTAIAVNSAHHFSNLEHIFAQVEQSLKPGGLFILHEYVGANRFQFDDRQRQVIEACLHLLPSQYRELPQHKGNIKSPRAQAQTAKTLGWKIRRVGDKILDGSLWSTAKNRWRKQQAVRAGHRPLKEFTMPTERSVIAMDPSEAIRSEDILPVLESRFEILENRPLGGSIIQFLLAKIALNFQNEEGEMLLEMLFNIEDVLMACDDIPSDFAYIVARPKNHARV